jgi:hypothetical protein
MTLPEPPAPDQVLRAKFMLQLAKAILATDLEEPSAIMLLQELLLAAATSTKPLSVVPWEGPGSDRLIEEFIPDEAVRALLAAEGIETYADLSIWQIEKLTGLSGLTRDQAWYVMYCQVAAGYRIPSTYGDSPWYNIGSVWIILFARAREGRLLQRNVPRELMPRQLLRHIAASRVHDESRLPVRLTVCTWLSTHGLVRVGDLAGHPKDYWYSQIDRWLSEDNPGFWTTDREIANETINILVGAFEDIGPDQDL